MSAVKLLTIGKLYVSHSTKAGSEKFSGVPFHSANITWKREDASTMSFNSPVKLYEADRVRYKSSKDFGGQIYKKKKSASGDYQYECISYVRLYHDKVTVSYKNKTSSQILKKVLKKSKNNFRTSGIKKTSIKHSHLKWENTSIWDIACQLAWLEHQAGFEVILEVDANGTLIFKYAPQQQKGYVFGQAYDFDEEYDSSDIITAGSITFNGKTLAQTSASKNVIAKWGYITEAEDCATSNASTESTAKSDKLKDESNISKYNIPKSVVDQALKIAKPGKSDYENLKLFFNWCDKNVSYEHPIYKNTKYGAAGTLKKRKGNCCDNAHLMIGFARTIGIKSRYCHSSGSIGHVFGEYYVNGKWFICDTGCGKGVWGGYWSKGGKINHRYDKLPY